MFYWPTKKCRKFPNPSAYPSWLINITKQNQENAKRSLRKFSTFLMVPCCVKGLSYNHISLLCPLPLPIPSILWTSDGLYAGDSQINPSSSHLSSGIYPVPWNCPIDISPPMFYAIPNTVAKTKFLFCFNLSNHSFTLWKTPPSILMFMLETGVT